jgi:predicted DNA-binding transcriptional regulator AlpA
MGDNHKQYLSVSEVAKMLGMGTSTLSKKLSGISIEGVKRDIKKIRINPAAIPEIKKMLDYNDQFDKSNYLSTKEVAKYLRSIGINAKRTDINNWIRSRNIPSLLHMGYRYIEQSDCLHLGQLIKEERLVPSGYCSVEDAAKLIDVHPGTIANWASDGDIESKFVIVDHYKRLYVATDKLSDVKLKRALNGLKNLQNADIEKIKKQGTALIKGRKRGPHSKSNGSNKLDSTQKWLTVNEVAQMLNIKNKSVQAFLRRGKFPGAVKEKNIWFIPESDVLKYQDRKISGHTFPNRSIVRSEKRVCVVPPDGFMTIKQAAALLGMSNNSVRRMINKGLFPSARKEDDAYWIIPKPEIDQYLERVSSLENVSEKGVFVPPEGFMKVEQAAKLLKLSISAVINMIQRDLFPSARKENNRYWIIAKSDIEQYLQTNNKPKVIFSKHEVIRELLDHLTSMEVSNAINKTHQFFVDYAQTRLNATGGRPNNIRRVLGHLKKLYWEVIRNLSCEIYELPHEEIEAILTNHKYSNPVREHFVMFLKYSYQSIGIDPEREYMFSRKHKSNQNQYRDEFYSPDIYQRFEHHVKLVDEHLQRAISDRYYANMWVMVTMLLTNAWRPSDVIFEMPRLDIDVIGVNTLDWFQQHKLSLQECQMIINQLYLKLRDVRVSKTNSLIHFLVAPDMVECLATACVISELHCRNLDTSILEDKRRLLGTFITGSQSESVYAQTSGQPAHMSFLEADPGLQPFSSRKLNNSTMTYLFFDIAEGDQDNAELAIEITGHPRSHEDAKTTAVYIKVTNKDGTMDRVAINLFKRGHFGWLYNYMVRLACNEQGHIQKLEERTTSIQALRAEYTPLQLERWAKSLIRQKQGRQTVIQRLSKMQRDTLQRLVIGVYKGKMPSRDGCGQCLHFPGCKYPQRKACIGCPEFIPQVQEVLIEARREFFRLIESIKTSHSETIIQRDSLFLLNILVLFQEAAKTFGVGTLDGFIPADQRKEALFSIADKIKIERYKEAASHGTDKRFASPRNQ